MTVILALAMSFTPASCAKSNSFSEVQKCFETTLALSKKHPSNLDLSEGVCILAERMNALDFKRALKVTPENIDYCF